MIEIVTTILKPIIDWFMGNSARVGWGIALIIAGSGIWYVNNLQDNIKELEKQIAQNDIIKSQLEQANKSQSEQIDKLQLDFLQANKQREKLDNDFKKLEKDHKDATAVFDKECGRFERLMQKKGSRLVSLANAATERVLNSAEAATSLQNENN